MAGMFVINKALLNKSYSRRGFLQEIHSQAIRTRSGMPAFIILFSARTMVKASAT